MIFYFSLNAQNFKIDFARFLSMNNFYDFDRLKISGESRLVMTKDSKIKVLFQFIFRWKKYPIILILIKKF